MTTVRVEASSSYNILIGPGLLDSLGDRLKDLGVGDTVLLVSDDNVAALYMDRALKSAKAAGFKAIPFVFPHGEASKCADTFIEILETAAKNRLCRKDTIAALGGGVTGDLSGFAAASYMRGINFVQIPTSVLAAVDSSVGGKTAIDLKAGKNLAGAFYQPGLVLCDTELMDTLPDDIFTEGSAEIIKYGILEDRAIIDLLGQVLEDRKTGAASYRERLEQLIARCVSIKAQYVHDDEFDRGRRAYLNLGHTYGHSIELLSGYETPHGRAVATGLVYAARISEKLGIAEPGLTDEISGIVAGMGFDTAAAYSYQDMTEAVKADKKRIGAKVTMILPVSIGSCVDREILWTDLRDMQGM